MNIIITSAGRRFALVSAFQKELKKKRKPVNYIDAVISKLQDYIFYM
jgi:hypothetical protein